MTESKYRAPALPRRLAAIIYDTFLVLPLTMFAVAVAMGISILLGQPDDGQLLSAWIVRGVAAVCCTGFFTAFWLKGGQTLGMQAWRIKLVALPGHRMTPGRALLRCAAAALSAGCLGLGYLWCLVDKHGRCWHDYLSATELQLLPGKKADVKVKKSASGTP